VELSAGDPALAPLAWGPDEALGTSPRPSARRIPALDGIRGLAILSVIYWHYVACPTALAAPRSLGGILHRIGLLTWSGVDLFFVLSGFLIGGILWDTRDERLYFQNFYVRRIFRILPLYLLTCGAGALALTLRPSWAAVIGNPMPLPVYAVFLQNVWLARNSWDVYLAVTWSLAVEEQFYLFFPFVVRFARKSWLPTLVGVLALASAEIRAVLYIHFGGDWAAAVHTLVFCRADALMLGALGAWAIRAPGARACLENRPSILRAAALVLGAAAVIMVLEGWTLATLPMCTFGYTCLALFYLSLVLLAVVRPSGWWASMMRLAPLRSLGRIAYCVYLVHETVFNVFSYWLGGNAHPRNQLVWTAVAASLVVSLGLAQLSWRYFESKMIRIGHRLSNEQLPSSGSVPVEPA
jgi:peptidoglycan/LPS O-acetylase OafA/YrhL